MFTIAKWITAPLNSKQKWTKNKKFSVKSAGTSPLVDTMEFIPVMAVADSL